MRNKSGSVVKGTLRPALLSLIKTILCCKINDYAHVDLLHSMRGNNNLGFSISNNGRARGQAPFTRITNARLD